MNYLSRENVQELLGLSPLQEKWLGNPGFVGQIRFQLPGNLDGEKLVRAWDEMVAAHSLLRTVYRKVKGRRIQVVLKERPIPVEWVELREASAQEQEQKIDEICSRHRKAFEPEQGPLFRMAFIRLTKKMVVVWTAHGIIVDCFSFRLLMEEWMKRYHGEWNTVPSPFSSYLKALANQDWSQEKAYWEGQLNDRETPTPLQLYDGKKEKRDGRGVCITSVPTQVREGLLQCATACNVSTRMMVQAAWALLLAVYTHETSVVFGYLTPGRTDENHEQVGPLGNLLPFRVDMDGNQRLSSFVKEMQETSYALDRYAYRTLDDIQRDRGMTPDHPLFHTALSVLPSASSTVPIQVIDEYLPWREHVPFFLEVQEGADWSLRLSYSRNEMKDETAQRILNHMLTLWESMSQSPEARLRELNFLPSAEQRMVFEDFNQTSPGDSLDQMVHEIIEGRVAAHPDAIAAVCQGRTISYGELNARANQLARWLRQQGVGTDQVVAIFADRSIEMLLSIVAVAKAGGAYVPLDPAHPDSRIGMVLETCAAKVILTDHLRMERGRQLADAAASKPSVLCLTGAKTEAMPFHLSDLASYPDHNLSCHVGSRDLANLFFTSGSTGKPKGAMVEHIGMLNHLWAKIRLLEMDESSVVAQTASHCFDISVWQFLAPLMVGGKTLIYPEEEVQDVDGLVQSFATDGVTILELVPTYIDLVLQSAKQGDVSIASLRYLVSTGEALSAALCRRWFQQFPGVKVVNAYGATECSDDTTHEVVQHPPDAEETFLPVGKPIPNIRVYVTDPWGRPVPIGCKGEVLFTGIGVGRGYLGEPQKTKEAFLPNHLQDGMGERLYRTGDLGYFLPDGRLVFVGRKDSQVKVRGNRIELGEVEAGFLRHPRIQQCVVVVRENDRGQNELVGYIVPTEPLSTDAIHAHLQETIPPYMIPEHIVQLEEMPLNRNGKIDRKSLPDPTSGKNSVFRPPTTPTEKRLCVIWEEVLDTKPIGIDDNFFQLGGHSLKLIQLKSRIYHQMHCEVPLRYLFEKQTICELARFVDEMGKVHFHPVPLKKRVTSDVSPMSRAQKRLYFMERLHPEHGLYHMPTLYEIHGPLQIEALKHALVKLAERHETLRSVFRMEGEIPVQEVLDRVSVTLNVTDLTDYSEEQKEAIVKRHLDEEARTRFQLESVPPWRASVIQLKADSVLFLITKHHIISDAWSWQVFEEECFQLYQSHIDGTPLSLPPLSLQYRDYAIWQNERLEAGELEESESFWRTYLSGPLPLLDLPVDFPRPPVQRFEGATATFELPFPLVERIRRLAQQWDATPFMVLFAVTIAFLHRLTGSTDLIVGTPVAGRNRLELERLIGFFVNTLPVRSRLQPNDSFQQLLGQLKQTLMEVYTHQEYPFDLLVEKLNPERDSSRPPIYSVAFMLEEEGEVRRVGPLSVKEGIVPTQEAKLDLAISMTEMKNGTLRGSFNYNVSLFQPDTVYSWTKVWTAMLEQIVTQPDQALESLQMCDETTQEQILRWSRGESSGLHKRCIHEWFEQQVDNDPDAVAVIYKEDVITYRQLDQRANRWGRLLQRKGMKSGDAVAICLERSVDLIAIMLGTLKAGGTYVPIDPSYPQERIRYIIDHSQARLIFSDGSLPLPEGRQLTLETVRTEQEIESADRLSMHVSPRELAYIIYTSGSTGKPKGVMVEHGGVGNFVNHLARKMNLNPQSRVLQWASVGFDASVAEIYTALVHGSTLCLADRMDLLPGPPLQATLKSMNITHLSITPSALEKMDATADLPDLSCLVVAGEASNQALITMWSGSCTIINGYGPTEATVGATFSHPLTGDRIPPIGRPVQEVEVYVLNSRLQPTPPGVPGEIYIGGAGLARGYLGHPGLTAAHFIPHPFSKETGARLYRTGDRGQWSADGQLFYLGRVDNQVKIRGIRIEPREVEAVLKKHASVKDCTVVARQWKQDTILVAYLQPHALHDWDEAAIRAYLRERLPEGMIPTLWMEVDQIPLTPNGKVDLRALPSPVEQRPKRSDDLPRDRIEWEMMRIWKNTLQVEEVRPTDHFFDRGGHSLKAVELVGEIKRRFAVELPLIRLFQTPTVAELCQLIREQSVLTPSCLVPLRESEGKDKASPIFLIHPQGGGVLCYFHLVRALAADAVYGLQAVGYDSDEQPLRTIDAMAERYTEEILRVAPHGPYRLGGWSFGATVAFEVARKLEEQNRSIEWLGFFDAHPLESRERSFHHPCYRDAMVSFAQAYLQMESAFFAGMDEDEIFGSILEQAKQSQFLPPGSDSRVLQRQIQVYIGTRAAIDHYHDEGPIRTDIHLYRVSEQSQTNPLPLVNPDHWQGRTQGRVWVREIPGNHHDCLEAAHAKAVAACIQSDLERKKQPAGM